MTTSILPQPASVADLKAGDRRLLRDMAIGWLTDVTDAEQVQRLLTLGYIVATAEGGYQITDAGRERIGFAKIEG